MEKLTPEEVERSLANLPSWGMKGNAISRRYKLATFPDAILFVRRVGDIAESKNHHPFISIDYRFVTISYTSWHAGGITAIDFDSAALCDEAFTSQSDAK